MVETKLEQVFLRHFGRTAEVRVQAPGRVNLIGEHTDYNDGFVLPAAIDRHITILASRRDDSKVQAYSVDFSQEDSFSLSDIRQVEDATWSNYVRGVILQFQHRGFQIPGMNLVIHGDVPIGAGLSSSAALEVASAETCRVLGNIEIDRVNMALLGQAAEHEFVGVQCGIMDQFISALGQQNMALLVDCRDLSYSQVPLDFEARIVVCDSRVQRSLEGSEYNQRRAECEQAVQILAKSLQSIKALRDVSPSQLAENQSDFPEIPLKRARHVITENARVLDSVEALRRGEVELFGEFLYDSHKSLRDDYEVSCKELDILVELASRVPGTLGARMTGAGFGGCTVNLVETAQTEIFRRQMKEDYEAATGIEPFVYVCRPSSGVTSRIL